MSHRCRCGVLCDWSSNRELKKPSNETLLCIAFASFIGFATVQTVVALLAKSQAMIGDSAAMAVDALAYGFNLLAEREKHIDTLEVELSASTIEGEACITPLEIESAKAERRLRHKRRQLQLELVPPLISVSVLLIVVGYVLNDAIRTLILDVNRSETEQSRPNIILMMTFSTLNLFVDIINVTCFARANHLTGYNTVEKQSTDGGNNEVDDNESLIERYATHFEIQDDCRTAKRKAESSRINTSSDEAMSEDSNEDDHVNLNMCSAYTHVFADTLRSISVVIAAIVALTVDSVSPEVADSTAAVIVSIIIFMSLLPLFRGIAHTWYELQSISREQLNTNATINMEGSMT